MRAPKRHYGKPERTDLNSPTANQFGCEPCPECGERYRYPVARAFCGMAIVCDDCGLEVAEAPAEQDTPHPSLPAPEDRPQ